MLAGYEDILTRMRDNLVPEVFEVEVPDDDQMPTSNGMIVPFYVVTFGGPIRAARGRNITGVRDHTNISYVTIASMSSTVDALKYLVSTSTDLLNGYKPTECGEMILEGGFTYALGRTAIRPTLYVKDITFTYRSNLKLES